MEINYNNITKEEIEKTISELMMKKQETQNRKVKLFICFDEQEQADKWYKEVWQPLMQEAFEKYYSK